MNELKDSRALAASLLTAGLLLTSAGSGFADVHYVDVNSTNATPPYTNLATAAANIQDAVDAAVAGDEIVVSNGIYATGGRVVYGTMTNRVAVDKPLSLRSVNGPALTVIQGCQVPGTTNGDGAMRCVYLTNGASLSGFTLTNGATWTTGDYFGPQSGGGLWCESTNGVVSNCVIAGNSASFFGGAVYLGTLNNCLLSNNSAFYGGGAAYSTLSNCALTRNSARSYGGGAYNCSLTNCSLSSNAAYEGGGAHECALTKCTLSGNSANQRGGGAYQSTVNDCELNGNSAGEGGGGACGGTVTNSTLSGNSAFQGGGASGGTLINCNLSSNSAVSYGGGAYSSTLNNCTLSSNSAFWDGGGTYRGVLNNCSLNGNSTYGAGGGAYGGDLNNCTLTGNSANSGGGAASGYPIYDQCRLNNCIVYSNTARQAARYDNYDDSYGYVSLNYCCTTPLPTNGVGNIATDPQVASASHLSAASPCRGAGNPAYASGTDIDGEPWATPPAIGCDEYVSGAMTGPLSVGITAAFTTVSAGFTLGMQAQIEGRPIASMWDFGDGNTATNQPFTSHVWAVPGSYTVVLRAYNQSQPGGISATVTVHVVAQPIHYVAVASANPYRRTSPGPRRQRTSRTQWMPPQSQARWCWSPTASMPPADARSRTPPQPTA